MKIKKITPKSDIHTYDFEVPTDHHYFLDNGCASHNTSSGIVMNATASWLPPQNKLAYQSLAEINTPIIPRYLGKRYWHYKGKFNYAAEDMLKVVRRLQRWVDTGISSEVYINPELTNIKKISDEILDGFDKGELKAVYYSLTIDHKEREGCSDCAN